MSEWQDRGCPACRQGVLSGRADVPERVATSLGAHAHLRRCQMCGSWWEENEREAHVIDEREARAMFPAYFTV